MFSLKLRYYCCLSIALGLLIFKVTAAQSSICNGYELMENCDENIVHSKSARADEEIIQKLKEKNIKLLPGLEIIQAEDDSVNNKNNSNNNSDIGRNMGYIERVLKYLRSHELKINLHNVIEKSTLNNIMASTFKELDQENEIGGKNS